MFGSLNPCQPKAMTGSGLLKKASGLTTLTGILATVSAPAVISIYDTATDETEAGAVLVVDSLTLVAGNPYPIPAKFNKGIYIKLVSGTGKWTAFFD